jgi:hypothetical protein
MNTPIKTIGKVGIGEKVLYPATSGTALDPSKRVGGSLDQIQLVSKELVGEFVITDDELEDNIEGNGFTEHMVRMITKNIANQLENVSVYAKTVSGATDCLQLFD